eukprot:4862009-Heterocapsa_arctica.AAC.1
MAERHDTDCHDRGTFEVPWQNEILEITDEMECSVGTRDRRGPAALAASLATSMSLFVSSTTSACIYALLPDELFAVFRRIKEATDAALIVAS